MISRKGFMDLIMLPARNARFLARWKALGLLQ